MERATLVHCCGCQQPIIRGEDFVCFKMPGSEAYQFFHRRFPTGDCWEKYLETRRNTLASRCSSRTAALGMIDKTTTSLGMEGDGNGRRELSSGF